MLLGSSIFVDFFGDLMIIGDVDETHHIHHIPMDPFSLVCSFKETTVGFYVSLSAESKSKLLWKSIFL